MGRTLLQHLQIGRVRMREAEGIGVWVGLRDTEGLFRTLEESLASLQYLLGSVSVTEHNQRTLASVLTGRFRPLLTMLRVGLEWSGNEKGTWSRQGRRTCVSLRLL